MKPKTAYVRGKVVPWKFRIDEEQAILDWFEAQSVAVDSLRYLVQKDIAEHGIRNIQAIAPQDRTIDTVRRMLHITESRTIQDYSVVKQETIITPQNSPQNSSHIINTPLSVSESKPEHVYAVPIVNELKANSVETIDRNIDLRHSSENASQSEDSVAFSQSDTSPASIKPKKKQLSEEAMRSYS